MIDLPKPGRRYLLAMLTALPTLLRAGKSSAAPAFAASAPPVAAVPFPEGARLLVAGPGDGALNRWADVLLPTLEQSLPADTSVHRIAIGAADGVTGANQFEALRCAGWADRAAGAWSGCTGVDGRRFQGAVRRRTLGAGDGRAEHRHCGRSAGRAGAQRSCPPRRRRSGQPGSRLRCSVSTCWGRTSIRCSDWPIRPRRATRSRRARWMRCCCAAPSVPEQFEALASAGAQSLFTLGVIDDTGRTTRDPAFPNVPHFAELYETRSGRKPEWSAVRCMVRRGGCRATGVCAGAATTDAGGDGLAVAARRQRCRRFGGRAGDRRRHSTCVRWANLSPPPTSPRPPPTRRPCWSCGIGSRGGSIGIRASECRASSDTATGGLKGIA